MLLGLVLCVIIGAISYWLGTIQHFVGAPVIGMFLGIILSNTLGKAFSSKVKNGAAFSSKVILRLGIILVGGTLSFRTIFGAGGSALPFILLSICFAFLTACLIGKHLIKVDVHTRILVASGTSICGGTAIATIAAVLDADDDDMAYAMTAIFLFDIFSSLLWPYLAYGLGLGPRQFSLLAGIAINDVASVTAAGATYDTLMGSAAIVEGATGGELAIVVKLTRVVMLVFVALAVMVWKIWSENRGSGDASAERGSFGKKIAKAFPLFILGFLGLALVNTFVDFSSLHIGGAAISSLFKLANKYLITVALVGVGLKISLKEAFTKGVRPILLGGFTWAVVALFTFSYVMLGM